MSKTFIIDGVETECVTPQEYFEQHPDDFFPIIPISSGTAEMILASDSVEIEQVGIDDIVVRSDK